MEITVNATTTASPEACWKAATTPDAIMQWNTASPDWICPSAEVDLCVGGTMSSRMEARDGSMGFDFTATFTIVDAPRQLQYILEDGRVVDLRLDADGAGTKITQVFDAESDNDLEMQRAGWQAILDSFALYASK